MSVSDRIEYAKMKARHHKEILPWYKKWWGKIVIVLIILFIIISIISTIYIIQKVGEIRSQQQDASLTMSAENYLKTIDGNNDNYYLGASPSENDSVITITNFSNFSCHYSAMASAVIQNIVNEFENDIRFVFRDYPSEDSVILAIGARCAGEQNAFWPMHDFLFDLQEDLALVTSEEEKKYALSQMADILELNVERFDTCVEERRYVEKVRKDYEDGEALEIKGTPTWFVNGYEIVGALSEDYLRQLIIGLKTAE